MAADIFLDLEGVDGESKDQEYTGKIDVLSFSWNISNGCDMSVGGGGGQGKACFGEIAMTMPYSKASPVLAQKCAQGTHIPKGVFTFRKSGDKPQKYKQITIEHVMITSVSEGCGGGGEEFSSISMGYQKIHTVYKEQNADGSLGAQSELKYDIKAGTAT
jgi:type VI secretion system secreted protein Hcp